MTTQEIYPAVIERYSTACANVVGYCEHLIAEENYEGLNEFLLHLLEVDNKPDINFISLVLKATKSANDYKEYNPAMGQIYPINEKRYRLKQLFLKLISTANKESDDF